MRKIDLILINFLIVVFEIMAMIISVDEFSWKIFTYYTQYSNFLTLISSFLLIVCLLKGYIPKWLKFIRYVTLNVMVITFLL